MFNLDLSDVPSSGVLTEGEYQVYVDEAMVKETKDRTGEYINIKFKTTKGETLYHMFNIKNKNAMAVEIGLKQLKSFLVCAGTQNFKLTSASELCGMQAIAVVKIKRDEYGEKNVISYFKKLADTTPKQAPEFKSEDIPF